MKYTLLSCAALALILPFSAYACPGEGPYESRQNMKMEKLDTDKNGALSTAEANAGAMMHFKAMDTNADGILSAAEFEKAPRPYNKEGKDDGATWRDRKSLSERLGLRRDKRFAVMDTDGNGSVSQSEFLAGAEKRHEMMDANKDGTITREDTQRRVAILINVRGRDTESFVHEAAAALRRSLPFPPGYTFEFGGQFKNAYASAGNTIALAREADLIIGAVLIPGAAAPKLLSLIHI